MKSAWLLLLSFLLAGCMSGSERTTVPVLDGEELTFVHEGYKRKALIHVPVYLPRDSSVPLVLALHGGGGNAAQARSTFGLDAVADREGFIVAYPEGIGPAIGGNLLATWNAEACCGRAMREGVDDISFIAGVLDGLEASLPIDAKRIYVTGHSNGALLAYRLACDLSNRITAIAPVGGHGALRTDCVQERAVPVLHVHGVQDECVPFEGGTCGGCFAELLAAMGLPAGDGERWDCPAVTTELNDRMSLYGCAEGLTTEFVNGAVRMTATECRDGAAVSLLKIEELGHAWPGTAMFPACERAPLGQPCRLWNEIAGPANGDVSAAEHIWRFFSGYALP